MLNIIKKFKYSIILLIIYTGINNTYLFFQYKSISSNSQITQLVGSMTPILALFSIVSLCLYGFLGWHHLKKSETYKKSVLANLYVVLTLMTVLIFADIILSLFVSNYAIIVTAYSQQNNIFSFIQLLFSRIYSSILAFGLLSLFSFIASKVVKSKKK
jgi:hypothetical protein